MSSELAIRVANLSKCYQIYDKPRDRLMQMLMRGHKQYFREFWAVRDVSFEIKKGETVGIVGRNGSGKSTLLQMICGTLNQTSGSIETQGRIAALLELGSGFNPEFTGRENVYLNAAVLGLDRHEVDECFSEIVKFSEIGDFIDQPTKTYSSGMLVRLAFSVQAMIEPDILIVDEALAVGDEKFQRKCFSRLEELKNRGTSILFVSHSETQIIELCDHALLIDHGELIMNASPLQIVRSYQRLIYAPEAEQAALLEKYKRNDPLYDSAPSSLTSPTDSFQEASKETAVLNHYDPNLIPETTTIYPEQGARIKRIAIHDCNGDAVNILEPMKKYRIVSEGDFSEDLERLFFGIHIRSISGAVISGQRHPEDGKYIDRSQAGKRFRVEFSFNMNLLPGTYFVGGGVWSENSASCAHRILDAIMFRVQSSGPQNAFGYCNLTASPAVLSIEE
ncbi:Vitamin B12 import ATP-binding protein BtuD [compost metagenome]